MDSAATGENHAAIKSQILAYAEDWFTDSFTEHYDVSDYESSIGNFQLAGNEVYAEIAIGAITTLKYDSVEDLPYMMGIKDRLQIDSLAEVVPVAYAVAYSEAAVYELQKSVEHGQQAHSLLPLDTDTQRIILTPAMAAENIMESIDMPITEVQATNLVRGIADIYVDAAECIGVGSVLTMDLIFEATYENGVLSQITLLEAHDGNATANATALIPLSVNQMKTQAIGDIITPAIK